MTPTPRTTLVRLAVIVAATLVGVAALPGVAAAHVTVNPASLTQGGFGRVAFRVPNESGTASTTKVEVFLPEEHPISSVSTMPVPGWRVTVARRTLAQPISAGHGREVTDVVAQITWTAVGSANAIVQGQFQEFPVSMGPLPQADRLVFKTLQTYSDGTVVRWIEEPAPGRELDHPAPVLTLTPKDAAGPDLAPVAFESGDSGGTLVPTLLSVIALLVGLAGVAMGGFAYAELRERSKP